MNKNSVIKGVGTAMAVGGTVAAISSAIQNNGSAKRKAKKTAAKAFKTVNAFLDGVQNMMG